MKALCAWVPMAMALLRRLYCAFPPGKLPVLSLSLPGLLGGFLLP